MMKSFSKIAAIAALVGVAGIVSAQDFVVVRTQSEWRAGYSTKLKDIELFGQKATLNAWVLTSFSATSFDGYSFRNVQGVYPGVGVQFPVYTKGTSTVGIAAGWSGDASNFTDAIGKGQWAVGVYASVKF